MVRVDGMELNTGHTLLKKQQKNPKTVYEAENVRLVWSSICQQHNDPKHIHVFKRSSQSPDLNPIERLWQHLRISRLMDSSSGLFRESVHVLSW